MADNIKRINSNKLAVLNKLYYDKDGLVYIGTSNGRLRLYKGDTLPQRTQATPQDNSGWTLGTFELDLGDLPIIDGLYTIAFPGIFKGDLMIPEIETVDKEIFNISITCNDGSITILVSSHVFMSGKYKINYILYKK
jgi:hypothetical protein